MDVYLHNFEIVRFALGGKKDETDAFVIADRLRWNTEVAGRFLNIKITSSRMSGLQSYPAQTQRISDDRDGTQAHRYASNDRTQQDTKVRIQQSCRDRNAQQIVKKCKE